VVKTKTCRSIRMAEDVKAEKKENKYKVVSKRLRRKMKDIYEIILTAEARTIMTQTSR
jgi:hypothetical protein